MTKEAKTPKKLRELVAVRMLKTGVRLTVEANRFAVMPGDLVVIRQRRVSLLAEVIAHRQRKMSSEKYDLIKRIANKEDQAHAEEKQELEAQAIRLTREFVHEQQIGMKPLFAEHSLDDRYIVVHFAAENRIDFRKLVAHLATKLHVRIEMRQTGVRAGASALCGIGQCGHELCCSRFMSQFDPVATRAIRAQGVAINASRNSGICGRLKCCYTFEYPAYARRRARAIRRGTKVWTAAGVGSVMMSDALSDSLSVTVPGDEIRYLSKSEYILPREMSAKQREDFVVKDVHFELDHGAVAVPMMRDVHGKLQSIPSHPAISPDDKTNPQDAPNAKRQRIRRPRSNRIKTQDNTGALKKPRSNRLRLREDRPTTDSGIKRPRSNRLKTRRPKTANPTASAQQAATTPSDNPPTNKKRPRRRKKRKPQETAP